MFITKLFSIYHATFIFFKDISYFILFIFFFCVFFFFFFFYRKFSDYSWVITDIHDLFIDYKLRMLAIESRKPANRGICEVGH